MQVVEGRGHSNNLRRESLMVDAETRREANNQPTLEVNGLSLYCGGSQAVKSFTSWAAAVTYLSVDAIGR